MNQLTSNENVHLQSRVIGDVAGTDGPTIVFFGGIHGNEPSGLLALQRVFRHLQATKIPIQGRVIGLAGNLPALASNQRFISQDLNRMWNADFTTRFRLRERNSQPVSHHETVIEHQQQYELFEIIEPLLASDLQTYFLDLHTTSAESVPFIAINDQLNNRNFAMQFPVTTVLGIEEYLDGPLLSYLNDFGNVALAFEAGQHQAEGSVSLHVAFIIRALVVAGIVAEESLRLLKLREQLAPDEPEQRGIFEVVFRHAITDKDAFEMNAGFRNFNPIDKGASLAHDRNGPIHAPKSGRIFMPLYQGAGNDGFFIVRKVPKWALKLSTVLRKINFEKVLLLLPGVSRSDEFPDALIVNQKIAFLLANEIFHLLGYRRKKKDGSRLIFSQREIAN